MTDAIAIVGIACRYPDARTPEELWENVLAQRRAFRRLPPERLDLRDYLSDDPAASDAVYAAEAALLHDYEFDRARFRVASSTFRSVDLVHWLALDVADAALRDAGFPEGHDLPRETTGVLVGNTLTGEFSRAAALRLRWPYVRRVVDAHLAAEGWDDHRRLRSLEELEASYKAPFPAVNEETLAGGLSNTIAGRICNQFHLGGGGYTVDGACSASLLAVAQACSALQAGDLDAAVAGGVDLSLDPFELVGFAKAGALARGEMRVYDDASSGFLPGEGCGFVVMLRHRDAVLHGLRAYALIRGWGISSDGGGGITRPEPEGQRRALERAYRRAGYGPETVDLFEGHGTGTPVGDEVELRTLCSVRRAAGGSPAALGSIKANIGHTKAAAGVAGLIKGTLALHHQIVPPATGVVTPHRELRAADTPLRLPLRGEPWDGDRPRRVGVSSFGFGGINVHMTLEGCVPSPRGPLTAREESLLSSGQDAELILFADESDSGLARQLERVRDLAPSLSQAELADLAAALASRRSEGPVRAAVVTRTPGELEALLGRLAGLLRAGARRHLDPQSGAFLGVSPEPARVGFLFPGQASPVRADGGALGRRFPVLRASYREAGLDGAGDGVRTEIAQPSIVAAEVAGLSLLRWLGVDAAVALGHSLGELAALHWAAVLDGSTLLRLARARGALMGALGEPPGTMASVGAGADETAALLAGAAGVCLACLNSPQQTVVSGRREAVEALVARARGRGLAATLLATSHAFHSPLMAPAGDGLREAIGTVRLSRPERRVVSSVTGEPLPADADIAALLVDQLTHPVRFWDGMQHLLREADLLIEVGPGHVLSDLAASCAAIPALSLDVGGPSLRPPLLAAAAAFALGAPIGVRALFEGRFTRPFDLERRPRFLGNPCESAPRSDRPTPPPAQSSSGAAAHAVDEARPGDDPLARRHAALVKELVAARAELPPEAVEDDSRLSRDLHLSSLAVADLLATAARRLGLNAPASPLDFADATIAEVGAALERMAASGPGGHEPEAIPAGIEGWVRAFAMASRPAPRPQRPPAAAPPGRWVVVADDATPLTRDLRERVREWPGNGVLVVLSAAPPEEHATRLVRAAHAVLALPGPERCFAVLQESPLAGGFARTLHLEHPDIVTCVVEAPLDLGAGERMEQELRAAAGHVEVAYDAEDGRWEPVLRLVEPVRAGSPLPLGREDVILASGGGKGITFECASALAGETGAALAMFGRSSPGSDEELASNLRRLAREGTRFSYFTGDVTDAAAVAAIADAAAEQFGPVTGILHGAGLNRPTLLRDLDTRAALLTMAPKVRGLQNLLAGVNTERLRLLVTFGSIIGRSGLRGEADYALANVLLSRLCLEFMAGHPKCLCLALESSVWADVGMGERLGRIDALRRQGIVALAPGEATAAVLGVLRRGGPAVPVVVAGRLGAESVPPIEGPSLPLLRFLERPRVHYPAVELVTDAEISAASDPYLADHVFEGRAVLPAVMGLEAMAQAAQAVLGERRPPVFEDVRFDRAIVVAEAPVTLRVVTLVRGAQRVEAALRSSETAFQVDHFRAVCCFDVPGLGQETAEPRPASGTGVPLSADEDLYGGLLFQRGRFRRLGGYQELEASVACARIAACSPVDWFAAFLPGRLVLGDPGARDAALHSIQACVPHAVLLPVGVERIVTARLEMGAPLVAAARQRSRRDDTYVYDLEIRDSRGIAQERWEGLRLRKANANRPPHWPSPLLATHIEWRLRELAGGARVRVALVDEPASSAEPAAAGPTAGADRDWRTRFGWHADASVSVAHSGSLTLAVAAPVPVGCDLEAISTRPAAVWQDILGPERWRLAQAIAANAGEEMDTALTRTWCALEALKKAGLPWHVPLGLAACHDDRWVCLSAPRSVVATCAAQIGGRRAPVVLAVLVADSPCAATSTAIA